MRAAQAWREQGGAGDPKGRSGTLVIGMVFLLLAAQFSLWRAFRHGPLGNEQSLNSRCVVRGSIDHRS